MRHRLQTTAGKTLYKLRQQTVKPGFGIINLKTAVQPRMNPDKHGFKNRRFKK